MANQCPVAHTHLEPVKNFIRPDKVHGCTYEKSLETHEKSPHHHIIRFCILYSYLKYFKIKFLNFFIFVK